MSDPQIIDYVKTIRDLEKKVDALSAPLEDALAYRVFQKSQEHFKKWITAWLAIVTVGLVFFGYKGYSEIVDAGRKEASDYVKSRAVMQLQEDVKKEFAHVREQVKETLMRSSLEDASKLESDLAKLLSETQANVDERLKNFATQVGTVVRDPSLAKRVNETAPTGSPLHGFAYYGIKTDGGWQDKYFEKVTGAKSDLPKKGDIVVAISPVNAREGVIEFDPAKGWRNKKIIGFIKSGNRLRVNEVKPVSGAESYIWIEFERTG